VQPSHEPEDTVSQTVVVAAGRTQARYICRDLGLPPSAVVVVTPGRVAAARGTYGWHFVGLENLSHFNEAEQAELRALVALSSPMADAAASSTPT